MGSGRRLGVIVWCLVILIASHEVRRAEADCIRDCLPGCIKVIGNRFLQCSILCAFQCACPRSTNAVPDATTDCYAMAKKVLAEVGKLEKLPPTPFPQLADVKPIQAKTLASNGKN